MMPVKRRRQLLTTAQTIEHNQRILNEFNTRFPVGTRVWYWKTLPFGPICETTVRREAFTADSGQAVCFLQGFSGYVSVSHVQAIDESRRKDILFDAAGGHQRQT